jgi:recombinational DNA repair protein RecT
LHDADWFAPEADRGEAIGVYAFAYLSDGGISQVVTMGMEEVGKHRAVAKQDHIWKKWPTSMYKKTAIRELRKWVPCSAEYRAEHLRGVAAVQAAAPPIHIDAVDITDE